MMYYLSIAGLVSSLLFSTAYATVQGQVMVRDPVKGVRTVTYEAMEGYAVVEGDILIDKLSKIKKQSAFIRPKISGARWDKGLVPYEISEDLPFLNKLAILQAMEHWQKNTNVTFVERNEQNSEEYPDYLSFIPAGGTLCASYVGRQGGKQIVDLSTRCNTMNTVHEIGHALGMWHEQSRNDRDNYVRILWENIEEDHKINFDQHLNDGEDYGEYDYQSIMHYQDYAFSKNGKKTIVPIIEGMEIGQRKQLSRKDIAAVNAMYPNL
jgi:hypothetical protein